LAEIEYKCYNRDPEISKLLQRQLDFYKLAVAYSGNKINWCEWSKGLKEMEKFLVDVDVMEQHE
jgi:hypothetical protein